MQVNDDELDKFHHMLMNVYTLNFIRDENKNKNVKKVALKTVSKTQRKKQKILKRIKLKESKGQSIQPTKTETVTIQTTQKVEVKK